MIGLPINIVVYSIKTAPSIATVTPFYIDVESYGYPKMIGNFRVPTVVGNLVDVKLII